MYSIGPLPPPWKAHQAPLLKSGEMIRMTPRGPVYVVESVSESRAYCVPLANKVKAAPGDEDDIRGGVNISSRSYVERVSALDLAEAQQSRSDRVGRVGSKEDVVSVAEMPLPDEGRRSNRELNKEMKMAAARKKADKHAGLPGTGGARKLSGAAAKAKANRKDRPPKTVRKCFCACGEETMGYFAPGHDGKYHGAMRKLADGRLKPEDLKAAWQKALGPFKKAGEGHVPSFNYKGEKYEAHA